MGSAGSGRFGTYRVGGGAAGVGSSSGAEGADGIGSGEIGCPKLIENVRLEDVAISEYYLKHHSLPDSGLQVCLRSRVHNGRLVVEKADSKEILGNLPTQYNFLINCIKRGMQYKGGIIVAGDMPVPFVVVTLHA